MKPCWSALAVALLGVAGCLHPQARLQSDEDNDRDKDSQVQMIGDATAVANAEPIAVSGVGLVVDLEGTGGPAPPSGFVTLLEDYLRKKGVENVKEILSSPNHAVVLVSAQVPAGARRGDPIDVEITLPPQSRVASLRGGALVECPLYNYSSSQLLSPNPVRPDRFLRGSVLAKAEGPILVGFGDGDESVRVKQGRIWGGGRIEPAGERPFYLALNPDRQSAAIAKLVANRINETFQGPYHGPASSVAEAKTKEVVALRVPPQYRHNLARFLRVVRLIPLQAPPPPSSTYRKRLEDDLLDPSKTISTALRLEALGSDTVPVLKKGLKSNHALVRFAAAEALAYQASPSSAEELAQLAADEPMLRSYCLTALASLDEGVCHLQLRELFRSQSPELRYGAFRALRALDEHDDFVQGEHLNEAFWLHRVAPDSPPLLHLSTSKRPEIVVFGEEPFLEPPFSFLAGPEFTVTAADGDERCTLSRFSKTHGTKRRQCSLQVTDVLRTLADMGGTYPDAVEFLRQADRNKCLSCAVAVDALPEAPTVQQLARAGRDDAGLKSTDGEILNARAEFGATPNLFQGASRRPR
jgi:flagellar basal body P-ring protein FlgI